MMVMACWKMPTSAVKTLLKVTFCLSNVGLPYSSLVLPVKWRAVTGDGAPRHGSRAEQAAAASRAGPGWLATARAWHPGSP